MLNLKKYRRHFTESKFWDKLRRFAAAAGQKTVYSSLLLYYAYQRKETPGWAKRLVMGVLGYLVMPFDVVPDLTPVVGYTDDFSLLGFALVTIAGYVNDGVREQARERLAGWFPETNEEALAEVDAKL